MDGGRGHGTQSLAPGQQPTASPVEEIYIARSIRDSAVAPTAFCAPAKTGFTSNTEDRFTLQSTAVTTTDGRITDTNVKMIGSAHGCLGPTTDPAVRNFYLELVLGRTTMTGTGDCRRAKVDFPEPGMQVFHCLLDLTDPSHHYVGGVLTSNTMNSRQRIGPASDPAGYVQPSIATIRLWKKRPGR